MGIVFKQSGLNLLTTVIGFGLGAVNTLVLATRFLSDEYFGVMGYVLSVAFLIFPLMSFGMHNTLVRFYTRFRQREERDSFLWQLLIVPAMVAAIISLVVAVFHQDILSAITVRNQSVGPYIWTILFIGVAQGYFEIFFAWTKVQKRTVQGNFLKEVFHRFGVFVTLILLALELITEQMFIHMLLLIYILRLALMAWFAFSLYRPRFTLCWLVETREILKFSALLIIAGSISTSLLDIDKAMLNQYVDIENISYYNVAVFIATVIAMPARGMNPIVHPLTAEFYNQGNMSEISKLYKKSSLNLLVVSGWIFAMIIGNLQEFYELLPPAFKVGLPVVFFIAVVRLSTNALGINGSILQNSGLYVTMLYFGVLLVLMALVLNYLLIPEFGIYGAAVATLLSFLVFAFAKAYYVYRKLHIHPWTDRTWSVLLLIAATSVAFYLFDFIWHPIVNMTLKSILITLAYGAVIYFFKLSTDIDEVISNVMKKIKELS